MARVVLDASVLIAYFDPVDRHHPRAVAALRRTAGDERIVISSVLAEILVHPYRVGHEAVAEVEEALAALPTKLVPVDPDIARLAAQLRARHARLRLGDALVVASGETLGGTVLTADATLARISDRVRLI